MSENIEPHPIERDSFPWPNDEQRKKLLSIHDHKVFWSARSLPVTGLSPHYLALGTTGSGKTNTMKMLMNSVLPVPASVKSQYEFPLRYRAIITDPKQDMVPFLHQMRIPGKAVIITNPFDARSSAWDIARDLTSYPKRNSFADAIAPLPEPGEYTEKQPEFWQRVVNGTIRGILHGLAAKQNSWDLLDIIEAASADHPERLTHILAQSIDGKKVSAAYYKDTDPKLRDHCLASVQSRLSYYQTTANLWRRANTRFTIGSWVKKGGAIILGSYFENQKEITPTNNLITKYAINRLLAQPGDNLQDLSWFFLDELSTVGTFPDLLTSLKLGRGKGIRMVLADQTYAALEKSFGKEDAVGILNLCGNKAILALEDPDELERAARILGQSEQTERSHTEQQGAEQSSTSDTYSERLKYRVPPRDIEFLPRAEHTRAVDAWFKFAGKKPLRVHLAPKDVDDNLPPKMREEDLPEGFTERPEEDQESLEWTTAELERFGIPSEEAELRWFDFNPILQRKEAR